MAYKLVYTKSAERDIKKLDRIVKKKIGRKIEVYSKSPKKYSRKLLDTKIGNYRWRVGKYRILFDLVGKDIVILRIRHRKESYR